MAKTTIWARGPETAIFSTFAGTVTSRPQESVNTRVVPSAAVFWLLSPVFSAGFAPQASSENDITSASSSAIHLFPFIDKFPPHFLPFLFPVFFLIRFMRKFLRNFRRLKDKYPRTANYRYVPGKRCIAGGLQLLP